MQHLLSDAGPGPVQILSAAGQDAGLENLGAPRIAVDSQDRATITWVRSDGANLRVESVRLSADGTPGPVQTHTDASSFAGFLKVAVDRQGRATIVWSRDDGGRLHVQSIHLDADGTPGAVQTLSPSGQRDAFGPEIAVDHAGRATVIWRLRENNVDRVEAVRLAANGVPGVTATLSSDGVSATRPQVALDTRGRARVTWLDVQLIDDIGGNVFGAVQTARIHAPSFLPPSCSSEPTLESVGRFAVTAIPDNNPTGITDTIAVAGSGVVLDVDVIVNLVHTRSSDLDVVLVAPDGTQVVLSTGNGFGSGEFAGTTFDDQAAGQPVTDATFVDGVTALHVQPEGALDALRGRTAAGSWQLRVADNAVADTGTLVGWELAVITVPVLPESRRRSRPRRIRPDHRRRLLLLRADRGPRRPAGAARHAAVHHHQPSRSGGAVDLPDLPNRHADHDLHRQRRQRGRRVRGS